MEGIITKIELCKKNKNRVNIYIDEEFAFACSIDLVYYHSIEKGKKVNLKLLNDVIEEDNYIKGKNHALKILEKSYKSEKEISDKLIIKGYDLKTVERIIDFLKEYDFINDEKLAERYIEEKRSSNGKNKIKFMLMKKGIREEIINQKLNCMEENLEEDGALKLARKKYESLIKSEDNNVIIKKKLSQYLLRRGYNWEDVKKILKGIVKDE
ncbi:regulatory protein RecX [Clostridium homopropionicum DSM 5847]|uniref:Regulatory protein RecX n=1 Tax=Clostridium homopropionicum DSM 5847 TaxID=1121318 RepID=A0A0L6ZB57_9CLOT|nr:recombination regulator RecX [Clostridium homopropionicum]KOA20187.1 regulatory protein RecX [Clostridium homopropionicum DSM 5847]SFG59899.1 regulatory protein [Clostridium homopropionicum]